VSQLINPRIHVITSRELDKDIENRLMERGRSRVEAKKLMRSYGKMISSWKSEYTDPKRGTHQSAENIADDIVMYEEI